MKTTILSLTLILLVLATYAQPRPDASLAPVVGTQCLVSTDNQGPYATPTRGASQTWNYSALGGGLIARTAVRIEDRGPRADINTLMGNYTSVTHRLSSASPGDTNHTYQYRLATANGLYEVGTFGQQELRQNVRPQITLKFGLNLGEMYIDSSRQNMYDSLGTTLLRQLPYRDTSQYLGYGTLILPNGDVYQNALLTKRGFSGRTADGLYSAFLVDSYDWYAPEGTGFPVFTIITDPGFAPLYFYTNGTITATEEALAAPPLTVAPNPARNEFMVRGLLPYQTYGIRILSMEGKEVLRFDQLPALSKIGVANLPPGVYSVVVTTSAGVQTLRFEKD